MTNLLQRFVDFATGELTADVNNSKVTTDKVNNAVLGDAVDYIDPRWITRTDALRYEFDSQTLDGITQSTSGSSSITLNNNNVTLSTGTTQNSDVVIIDGRSNEPWTWDKDRSFRCRVDFKHDRGPIYVIRGDVTESDKTLRHIGFVAEGGDLKGTVADGGTQNKVTLISGFSTGVKDLRFELDDSNDSVEFFVDGTSQGSTSTNIPSSTTRADKMRVFANNTNGSNDRSVAVDKILEVQNP